MENQFLIEIEEYKVECLIFDCDLLIDSISILRRAWNDVCELYSFQYFDNSQCTLLLRQKSPKEIAQILKSKESTSITVDEILLSYERFFERILFSTTIQSFDGMVQILQHFNSSHQLGLISRIHQRDVVLLFLSATGLLNFFDIIITIQDLPLKLSTDRNISIHHKLYQHLLSRLKLDSSVCLFFDDLPEELEKHQLSTYKFFPLKHLPETIFPPIQHLPPSSLVVNKNKLNWNGIVRWIVFPSCICLFSYLLYIIFKSMNPLLVNNK